MIGNYRSSVRVQKFLGNLFVTERICDEILFHVEKVFKIFGFSFLKRIEDGILIKWYFFNFLFNTIDLKKIFIKKYSKVFGKTNDCIFFLSSNSGEAYIFLTHVLDVILKRYDAKKPLIVATKKYHVDLIKTICPEIPYRLVKPLKFQFKDDVLINENQKYFLVFSQQHFLQVLSDVKKRNVDYSHYYSAILSRCNVKYDDVAFRKVFISSSIENSMLSKIKDISLNLDNFVLICPGALSAAGLSNSFWQDLVNKYKQQGIDVFVNLVGCSLDLSNVAYKTCYLTYSELFSLATRAKRIVSLRSGLCEYLLQTGVPTYVLYSNFHYDRLTPQEGFKLFSMQKLKSYDKNNIFEFIVNSDELDILKEKITNNL